MKVAIITPYRNESRDILTGCIESVASQTVSADQIIVCDGAVPSWLDDVSPRHPHLRTITLDIAHTDHGETPRFVGFLAAAGDGYEAIAFLDPDHRVTPDHIATCITAATGETGPVDLVIPCRELHRPDGSVLPIESEEIDGGYLDVNCHVLFPGAYGAIATWGTSRKPAARDDHGHVYLYNLGSERLRARSTDIPTVWTTCRAESVYRFIDETPPDDVQPVIDSPIWLLGDGRSGTTWLFELLNYHSRYRAFFEPFNPGPSKPGVEIGLHRYLPPDGDDRELEKHLADIFSGRFHEERHPRSRPALFQRVLVKDIYANLFAYWGSRRFPNLRIILIIRHPFAVAASKLNVQNWFPNSDLSLILSQERLVEDHLKDHLPLLRKVARKNDFVVNQIAIWSVINAIPLRQFSREELHVVLYEELMEDPVTTLSDAFVFVDAGTGTVTPVPSQQIIDRPSSSTARHGPDGPEQILPSEQPEKWELMLTREQIRWGLRILDEFGFRKLYDTDPMPHHDDTLALF